MALLMGGYPERVRLGVPTRTLTPGLVDLVVEEAGAREERTPSLIRGIMRSGAVYLPLDPLYPDVLLADDGPGSGRSHRRRRPGGRRSRTSGIPPP